MTARRLRQLADALTLGRGALGLPLLLALQWDQASIAWWVLLLGGLSDGADGWLARKAGGGSSWGARLDPLTDKILISAPLLWLGASGVLPLWAIWLLLARELAVTGWRTGLSSGGPASLSAKAKTSLQFVALSLMLWPPLWPGAAVLQPLGWWLFWPSLVLALWSALGYLRQR